MYIWTYLKFFPIIICIFLSFVFEIINDSTYLLFYIFHTITSWSYYLCSIALSLNTRLYWFTIKYEIHYPHNRLILFLWFMFLPTKGRIGKHKLHITKLGLFVFHILYKIILLLFYSHYFFFLEMNHSIY